MLHRETVSLPGVASGVVTRLGRPCKVGPSPVDVWGGDLVFECDCGPMCDDDYMVYWVDMAAGSGAVRVTCDTGLSNDREDPVLLDNEVLYTFDGSDDLYRAALGSCANEAPVHATPSWTKGPGGDPDSGAVTFCDDQGGSWQLWGVIPPPPVDVTVTSFYFDAAEIRQNGSYGFNVDVRNLGSQTAAEFTVEVVDGVDGVWQTAAERQAEPALHRPFSGSSVMRFPGGCGRYGRIVSARIRRVPLDRPELVTE